MTAVMDLEKERTLENIQRFLKLNLDDLFKKIMKELNISINKNLRSNAIFILKEIRELEKKIKEELLKINFYKRNVEINIKGYSDIEDNYFLHLAMMDLKNILKSFKSMHSEIINTISAILEDEKLSKKITSELNSLKILAIEITNLETNIHSIK